MYGRDQLVSALESCSLYRGVRIQRVDCNEKRSSSAREGCVIETTNSVWCTSRKVLVS